MIIKANWYEKIVFFILFIFITILFFVDALVKNKLIAVGDGIYYNFPLHHFYATNIKNFKFPLWLPNEYLGMPFIGLLQAGAFYPINFFLHLLFSTSLAYNLNLLFHYFISNYFLFSYLRLINCNKLSSFIGAVTFSFSGFMIGHHGHIQMQNAAALIPLLLYFYEKLKRTPQLKYALFLSFIISMQILAGHFQITVYTIFYFTILLIYYIKPFYRNNLKLLYFYFIALIIAIVITAPQLIETKDLADHSYRIHKDYQFFTEYSLAPYHLITLIFPFFYGGGFNIKEWGPGIFADYIGYLGSIALIFALSAIITERKENQVVKSWSLILFLSIFLALGKYNPFYKIMFYFPIYNLFRVPARNILFFDLAIAILSAIAINNYTDNKNKFNKYQSFFKYSFTILLIGILIMIPTLKAIIHRSSFKDIKLVKAKAILLKELTFLNPVFLFPIIIIMLALAIIIINKKKLSLGKYFLASVILIDLLIFNFCLEYRKAWLPSKDIENLCKLPLYQFFANNIDRAAFIDTISILNHIQCNIQSINGYDPLIMKKYADIFDIKYHYGYIPNWNYLVQNNHLLSLFNVKYIVTIDNSYIEEKKDLYKKLMEIGKVKIYLNKKCLPRIFSINKLEKAKDIHEIRRRIQSGQINYQETAFLYEKDYEELKNFKLQKGQSKIIHYDFDKILINTKTSSYSFYVVSDIYYPGWKAYLNGKEIKIYEANGLLKGLLIPPGLYSLELIYKPPLFYYSIILSLLCLLISIALLTGCTS